MKTHYEILGVKPDSSEDEIRSAHRALVRTRHPDVCKESGAESEFKKIQAAFEILGDASKRTEYDLGLRTGERHAAISDDSVDTLLGEFFDFITQKRGRRRQAQETRTRAPSPSRRAGKPDVDQIPDGISTAVDDPFGF